MKNISIYIDGASKGNPGPAGVGVVICEGERILKNISNFIGKTTNNIAEYMALIYALQEALILKAENITINTDSQLLYRQIKKEYRVKNPNITNLYKQVMHLLSGFNEFKINFIPRKENRGADKLANKAIKEAIGKKVL
ncbi:MAG: ribonuclease HI family protein [Candidatus Omnitrophica bacterium]|nr:ribonuclease HI family protein [Candidatus Omnitrophota bacterium]